MVQKSPTAAELLSKAISELERLEKILPDADYWNRIRRRAAALAMSLQIFLPDVEDVDAAIKPPRSKRSQRGSIDA